ncbi:MAG: tRNA uridine-5-carboxymethylaminomethyl(34) synthesis enzyme MnmG [Christensenellales bacterium]
MSKENEFDAVVIGAGHAGSEASLALARTGNKTLLITLDFNAISFLACNPSIGGTAKGHLVCEIDALGGEMGKNADKTILQLRMLNESKGPAVHSLRAQVDKNKYHSSMQETLLNQENLTLVEDEASEILVEDGKVSGVKTASGKEYKAKVVVIATGVYLNSRTIIGEIIKDSGPANFKNATKLTQNLIKLGFKIKRFKTGTPPRLNKFTIDYSKFSEQKGDENIQTFSFLTQKQPPNVASCYLGYTTALTKKIILDNINKAPMYSGTIVGVGPRYCPSIETKIVRFSDKERHQVFLEPETLENDEIYLQGMSTSMPMDIQKQMVESINGLENTEIVKYGYAIEYDAIDCLDLYPTLAFKKIKGIYTAGQINGTSGYEEAGAQGIVAGINASLYLRNKPEMILTRDSSYIGVLIDDLVTKGTNEPYRMMTSRAEYRLLLRQDNADIRLTEIGRRVGLVDDYRYGLFKEKMQLIEKAKKELTKIIKPTKQLNQFLASHNETEVKTGITVETLIKRTNLNAFMLQNELGLFEDVRKDVLNQINIEVKYEGYLTKQKQIIDRNKKLETKEIPADFDYSKIKGLRIEAVQKLSDIKPLTIGQASRISGVSPADITVLLLSLKK